MDIKVKDGASEKDEALAESTMTMGTVASEVEMRGSTVHLNRLDEGDGRSRAVAFWQEEGIIHRPDRLVLEHWVAEL